MLFLYFAGHGLYEAGTTFLCPSGANPQDLNATAISGDEIATVLSKVKPRGLLVVLDCCEGAGFVENAPLLFRQLGDSDFRIVIASSRVGQSSWELPSGGGTLFTRHLTEVLNGTVRIGEVGGIITFSELFEYLALQISEELRSRHDDLPPQDPIFAGTYPLNPVLFVHKGLTLSQVSVRVARYSKAYIQRLFWRVFLSICAIAFLTYGSLLNFWQHSEYIDQAGGGNIEILRGHPSLKWFRTPRPLWVFNFGPEAIQPSSPLKLGQAITVSLGASAVPILSEQLTAEFRARLLFWDGRNAEARSELKTVVRHEDAREVIKAPGRESQVVNLFAQVPTQGDEITFEGLRLGSIRKDIKVAAIQGLIHLDPNEAARDLDFFGDQDVSYFPTLLRDFEKPCAPNLASHLSMYLNAPKFSDQQALILDTALRLGCRLDEASLVRVIEHSTVWGVGDISYFASAQHLESFDKLLLDDLSQHRREPGVASRLLLALSYTEPSPCPAPLQAFLKSPDTDVRQGAALVLLRSCGDKFAPTILAMPHDVNAFVVLAKHHLIRPDHVAKVWLSPLNTLHDWQHDKVFHAIQYLDRNTLDDDTITDLIIESNDMAVKANGVALLRDRGAPSESAEGLFAAGGVEVQEEAYRWYLSQHRQEGFQLLFHRLDNAASTFVIRLISTLTLTDAELEQLRSLEDAHSIAKLRAVAILTMKSDQRDVVGFLRSPDYETRETAYDYIGYRSDIPAIQKNLNTATQEYPDPAGILVNQQSLAHQELVSELNGLSPELTQRRLRLHARTHTRAFDRGLVCWIAERLQGLWTPDESLDTPKERIISQRFTVSDSELKKLTQPH
jgi:hypothetical protein